MKKRSKKVNDSSIVERIHPICCGIDVHKKTVVACLIGFDSKGKKTEEVREFSSFTDDLFLLRDWLVKNDCPIVGMESTGIYWRPVHNILEDCMVVTLVNARHYKNVPGRKTDVCDSKWLAGLLQVGLLKGSFIPRGEVREWRELTQLRRKMVKTFADHKRRVHKVFETANIKIDSVVSDLFGLTGRHLMEHLCQSSEVTLEEVEKCAKGRLRSRVKELYRSIQGFFTDHHRFLLQSLLRVIDSLEAEITTLSRQIRLTMKNQEKLTNRLDEVPGINETSAHAILGMLGDDLSSFRSEDALSSWSGLSPGNNESAGKRNSGKSPVRKHPLKEIMIEIAWAAIKKKGSYYKSKYYKLKARRGAKRAITAVAHRILKVIYFIIKEGLSYKELGEEYLDKRIKGLKLRSLKLQAKLLGFELKPVAT